MMRKLICLLISLMMCASLALPALAAETLFIPSYGLEVKEASMGDEDVKECVAVTSVPEAKEESTDISQEERDLLVEVYDALSDGSMKLPVQGGFQYVEMMDVHFALENCRQKEDHAHADSETALTVTFELEVEVDSYLMALVYVDEKWELMEDVVVNNDDTVTIIFEKTGPVVLLNCADGAVYYPGYELALMEFVPSVTYKDGPAVDEAVMGGMVMEFDQEVTDCVIVTSIKQAKDESTDISQEDREFLLELYEKLEDGSMTLPLKGAYVIRDMVNVGFAYEGCCQDEEHGNKGENLAEKDVTLTVTFDMDVDADENVIVMVYVEEEWVAVEEVKNNGDDTVTCIFEDIGPVVFVVNADAEVENPITGDAAGNHLMLVMGLMVLSAVGIVALVTTKARKVR